MVVVVVGGLDARVDGTCVVTSDTARTVRRLGLGRVREMPPVTRAAERFVTRTLVVVRHVVGAGVVVVVVVVSSVVVGFVVVSVEGVV